tara:strand:- start:435 stop:638 length:204 start_codon:yes stop_codon:yes gene_type:complete
MNLLLRPLNDVNDPTWSIIILLVILLAGVAYYIYTIMDIAFTELENGSDQPERCESGPSDSTSDTPH